LKLGVLVSGKGSNLRNLVRLGFDVVAVATNRPGCPAAAWTRQRGIPLGEFSQRGFDSQEARDAATLDWLQARGVELVVNAGYDRILSTDFVRSYQDRILNLHPSLLPAFAGTMNAVEEALAAGVAETGCTVHLVTDDVDAGPILIQGGVPVLPSDSAETLLARIQQEEHRILPEAIRLMERRVKAGSALG
jgi:phosphoribosylglycinamide formyltransferase-1